MTKTAAEFHGIFDDEELEVIDVTHINDNLDRVVYRRRTEFQIPPSTNCVPIAAMVTAYGRQRLFAKFVEAVSNGAQLIYADTDSLMLKRNIDKPAIEEGSFQKLKKLGFLLIKIAII